VERLKQYGRDGGACIENARARCLAI